MPATSSSDVNPRFTNRIFKEEERRARESTPNKGRKPVDMCSAVVVKLPEVLDAKNARKLARELKSKFSLDSLAIVLDLSHVKDIHLPGLEALLSCMEEAARRDVSLQLSGVSPQTATFLELTRLNQLMQKFPGFSIDAPQFETHVVAAPEAVPAESPVTLPVAA